MRKLSITLMIMAAAISVSWLDSCCKDKDKGVAISMGISEQGTKAVVSSKPNLISQAVSTGTGFGVYGYKTVSSSANRLFDNVEVHPASNSEDTDWTYAPIRYWDKNTQASYQFIAYWPHLGSNQVNTAYVSEQDQELTIHNIPFWQDASLAESADFMTATRKGNYTAGDFNDLSEPPVAKVRFTFSHILAKLVIRAYYVGTQQNLINITGLSLTTGVVSGNKILGTSGKASYTQSFGENTTAAFADNTPNSTTTHILYHPENDGITLPTSTFCATDESEHDYQIICEWLMVPCSGWQDLGLRIDYSIAGSSTIPFNVNGLTLSTTGSNNQVQTGVTASGKSYVVTLKFDSSGGGVDLQSVLVKDWEIQEINTGVYNW